MARLQLGEEEPAEAGGAETPRGGAAENSFDSEESMGTVQRYLLESSGERSLWRRDGGERRRRHRAAQPGDVTDEGAEEKFEYARGV